MSTNSESSIQSAFLDRAFSIPKEQILGQLRVKISDGLSDQEVQQRLEEHGPNSVEEEEDGSLVMDFLEQFTDPLVLLLLGSAIISVLLKQYDDAFSIFLAVIIVSTVAFVQGYKSDQAVAALQSYVKRKCTVIRNYGHPQIIPVEDLVPGDIVKLEIGNIVPADIRLVVTSDLRIQEALLTGEPKARNKHSKVIQQKVSDVDSISDLNDADESMKLEFATVLSERKNMAFMGTKVANGTAIGVVIGTGQHTQLSKIAQQLKETESKKTPLQEKMDELGKHLSLLSFIIIAVIFVVGAIKGHPWIDMFNVGVSLAVAAIPEGLPIVVTVTLALGVQRMSKKNAIVRRLPAVEALGSASVCCVDKTGTLTQNEMTVTHFWSPSAKSDNSGSGQFYVVNGVGYGNQGSVICNNQPISSFTPDNVPDLHISSQISSFCNNAVIHRTATGSGSSKKSELLGQPTEGALLAFAEKCSVLASDTTRIREIPFNSVQKWMAVQCNNPSSPSTKRWYIKGALEWVLPHSSSYFNANTGQKSSMNENVKQSILTAYSQLTGKALRCVALAYTDDPSFAIPIDSATPAASTEDLTSLGSISLREKSDPHSSLVFCGIVGIIDPPRPGIKSAVKLAQEAHIQLCMITGDAQPTAEAIAHELGFFDKSIGDKSMNASQVELWAKRGLLHEQPLERIKVFYRASPFHKSEIVKAFQKRGHVVAMTGDGVNDAISLKLADIGIAMGDSADVTKEVAEMILVDNNFSTIIAAIEEGKNIFNNIGSFLEFQLTTSIAALSIVAMATVFGFPLPLSTTMILTTNMIMDGFPAQSLGVGERIVGHSEMKKPPRPRNAPILTKNLLYRTLINASIMITGTLFIFYQYLTHFGTVHPTVNPGELTGEILDVGVADDSLAITATFCTFIMFQMFNAYNCRSPHKSVLSLGLMTNFPLFLSISACIISLVGIVYVPYLQFIFNTTELSFYDWKNVMVTSSSIFFVAELRKALKIFNT